MICRRSIFARAASLLLLLPALAGCAGPVAPRNPYAGNYTGTFNLPLLPAPTQSDANAVGQRGTIQATISRQGIFEGTITNTTRGIVGTVGGSIGFKADVNIQVNYPAPPLAQPERFFLRSDSLAVRNPTSSTLVLSGDVVLDPREGVSNDLSVAQRQGTITLNGTETNYYDPNPIDTGGDGGGE